MKMKNSALNQWVVSLLLALFVCQGGIGYWILQKKLSTIKEEMKAQVLEKGSDNLLTQIYLTAKEYKAISWSETWEFEYQGKMYDLWKRELHKDGSITLYAAADNEENELNDLISSLVQSSSDKKKTQEHLNFFYKFQSQWICDFNFIETLISESSSIHFPKKRFFVSSPHVRLHELPPNC